MRISRTSNLLSAVLGTLFLLGILAPVQAAEPVGVVGVDAANCTATLKDLKTGRTFQITVDDKVWLKALTIGQSLEIAKAQPTGATGNAAQSGTTATTSGAGSCSGGNNDPRGSDTRPRECFVIDKQGRRIPVVCPPPR